VIQLSVTNCKCLPWRLAAPTPRPRLPDGGRPDALFDIDPPFGRLVAAALSAALRKP
jgi:hypothetical protein